MNGVLRIGAGAGYSGDRVDPAVELAREAGLDYLVFECLAERTIALAQLSKLRDPGGGYDPLLAERMRRVLPIVAENGTRVLTNMGAANPVAAAQETARVARDVGLHGLEVMAVTGDDVLGTVAEAMDGAGATVLETGEPVSAYADRLVSANAYLGVAEIVDALAGDQQVIITGRVADPSLFLAPMVHEFGWPTDDYDLMGQGTVVGHLLECAGQLTGGYFADPVTKPVPNMARLGFPYAMVEPSGEAVITKLPEAGGEITLGTCKEQLLYEIGDPARYLTPDVTADYTSVRFDTVGKDTVRVSGGTGGPRPDTLKVALGYRDGFMGECEISYAGPHAAGRARLAADIVAERLEKIHRLDPVEMRTDYVGESAAFRGVTGPTIDPVDVRLRVAVKTRTEEEAEIVVREVESLYTNGPAGGGGARKHVTEVIGVVSTLLPRERVSVGTESFKS